MRNVQEQMHPKAIILIVAFSNSIHTSRWIQQIDRSKFRIHLFPSMPFQSVHPGIHNIIVHQIAGGFYTPDQRLVLHYMNPFIRIMELIAGKNLSRRLMRKIGYRKAQKMALKKTIELVKPDIIHTMETQHAGYLMSEASYNMNRRFKWLHSTWGIDLHYFGNFEHHKLQISQMLSRVDLLICEGDRDVNIAKKLGYQGNHCIMPSVGGGLDFDLLDSLPHETVCSHRKIIMLKGYDGDERLASVALNALRKIKTHLQDHKIIIYSCSEKLKPVVDEIKAGQEFTIETTREMSYLELLQLTCEARISITNNLSDGVPNTMLEAMALGAFPIQSRTAITTGWIENGKNGLLTDPEDVDGIAAAILNALNDDELVNRAAEYNKILLRRKLDKNQVREEIMSIYTKISFS
jgi:glycosyltransferase involved in cell wall biosynthesis